MGDFTAEWLTLREPADHAARSANLTQALVDALKPEPSPRILDLASGTGSNFRYLTTLCPGARWLLVDRDAALLARAPKTPSVETRQVNLATFEDRTIFAGRALVTASALLDLVSEAWLGELAALCALNRPAVLFALSYDGRIECVPADAYDAQVVALVNEHQLTDKGFGPALGPTATTCAERCFRNCGYRTRRASSDWILTPASQALQRPLIDGWAQAATELAPLQTDVIEAWRRRRHAHVDANQSHIVVGHEDILGIWGSENLRI
jgi:hypothetical protein